MYLFRVPLVLRALKGYLARKGPKGPEEKEDCKGPKDPRGNKDARARLVPAEWLESKGHKALREFGEIWGPRATRVLWVLRESKETLDLWA